MEACTSDQSTYPHVRYPHEKQSLNEGLLTMVVPLIRPYKGFISHGGTLHGGRLTGHAMIYHTMGTGMFT